MVKYIILVAVGVAFFATGLLFLPNSTVSKCDAVLARAYGEGLVGPSFELYVTTYGCELPE